MNIGSTQWEFGKAGNGKHTQTHTHTHTNSVPRDTQGGWSLGQGSNATLTHVSVALHSLNQWAMKIGRTQWGVGDQAMANTHTHGVTRDKQCGWSLGQ